MPQRDHDVIVIGAGSMGSSACYHLALQGYRVLGLEQFDKLPHDKGAHAGQSRIIRKAYFEHPDYVPLLNRAYENWDQLEELAAEQVYFKTGLLYCGPRQHEVIRGVKKAAEQYSIGLSRITDPSAFPAFSLQQDDEMLLEPDAGFLLPEKSIALFIQQAVKNGADIRTGEKVTGWKRENGKITVSTGSGNYTAKKLVITAGAWTTAVIKELKVPLNVTRQVIVWVEPVNPAEFLARSFSLLADGGCNDQRGLVWISLFIRG